MDLKRKKKRKVDSVMSRWKGEGTIKRIFEAGQCEDCLVGNRELNQLLTCIKLINIYMPIGNEATLTVK